MRLGYKVRIGIWFRSGLVGIVWVRVRVRSWVGCYLHPAMLSIESDEAMLPGLWWDESAAVLSLRSLVTVITTPLQW